MKLFTMFLMLFSFTACAGMQSVIHDASSTNITTAYASIMSNISANNVCCQNHLGSTIRVCLRSNTVAACADDWYMEDGDTFCFENHPMASSLFVKSESGTISTGILSCKVWLN